jgi:hypothetical protein
VVEVSRPDEQNAECVFRLAHRIGAATQAKLLSAFQMDLGVIKIFESEFAQS